MEGLAHAPRPASRSAASPPCASFFSAASTAPWYALLDGLRDSASPPRAPSRKGAATPAPVAPSYSPGVCSPAHMQDLGGARRGPRQRLLWASDLDQGSGYTYQVGLGAGGCPYGHTMPSRPRCLFWALADRAYVLSWPHCRGLRCARGPGADSMSIWRPSRRNLSARRDEGFIEPSPAATVLEDDASAGGHPEFPGVAKWDTKAVRDRLLNAATKRRSSPRSSVLALICATRRTLCPDFAEQ